MNMLIDVALIVVFLYLTVKFYKIGILGAFFGTARLCLSLAASYLLGEPASRLILSGILKKQEYTAVESVISLIASYILVFSFVFLFVSILGTATRRAEPRFIYKIDRFLGACLGITIGLCAISLISNLLYYGIEMAYTVSHFDGIMNVYNDSVIFKTVFELSVFDYVKNLIY